MKDEVHARDCGRGQVLLLAIDLAIERAWITAFANDVFYSAEQHAARAAGWIVDGFAFLGVEDLDHHAHNAARSVELASLVSTGDVSELTD